MPKTPELCGQNRLFAGNNPKWLEMRKKTLPRNDGRIQSRWRPKKISKYFSGN